ncbi:MAG: nucleotide disphospho-sugar-binding domain-containing protein [Solirubrobacterales bacterium]
MRILFCISGIGSGHVSRCEPLLNSLIGGGHECSAALTGFRAGRLLEGTCPVDVPPPGYRERVAPPQGVQPPYLFIPDLDAVFSAYQRDAADGLIATLSYFDGVIERTRPDLLVIDQVLGVGSLAASRGIPVVQVTHPPFLPDYGPWARWLDGADPRVRTTPVDRILETAFGAIGRPAPAVDTLIEGDATVVPGHPVFGTCRNALHLRPGNLPSPAVVTDRPSGSARVLVYLSFRAWEIGEPVLRGVLAAGCRADVVDDSAYDLPEDLAAHPMLRKFGRIPIDNLLGETSAVIHGGGFGIAQEALAAGLPQIMIPRNTEQETTARAVESLGAGLHVPVSPRPMEPFEVSADFHTLAHLSIDSLGQRVATALTSLIEGDYPSSAALQAGEEIQSLPLAGELIHQIEALLPSRS